MPTQNLHQGAALRSENRSSPGEIMPPREDSESEDRGKCYSPTEQKVVPMGSGFISAMKEKLGPSVEIMMGRFSPSVEAARGMFGSKEWQQNVAQRLVFYVVPPAGAALTFGATLLGAQAAGAALRVSCATPVVASVMGCIAICTASAAAAQVSYRLRRFYGQETMNGDKEFLAKDSLIVNALFGIVAFKVLGGKFHNLMPSSVIHPGALHSVSIPARGSKYANDVEQVLIQDIFKRHGCHHCGKKFGESIADHMPPNVIAYGRGWAKALADSREANSFLARLRSTIPFLTLSPKVVQQRLYPQCTDCCKLQSAALRHGKRAPLVFHFKRGVPEMISVQTKQRDMDSFGSTVFFCDLKTGPGNPFYPDPDEYSITVHIHVATCLEFRCEWREDDHADLLVSPFL